MHKQEDYTKIRRKRVQVDPGKSVTSPDINSDDEVIEEEEESSSTEESSSGEESAPGQEDGSKSDTDKNEDLSTI